MRNQCAFLALSNATDATERHFASPHAQYGSVREKSAPKGDCFLTDFNSEVCAVASPGSAMGDGMTSGAGEVRDARRPLRLGEGGWPEEKIDGKYELDEVEDDERPGIERKAGLFLPLSEQVGRGVEADVESAETGGAREQAPLPGLLSQPLLLLRPSSLVVLDEESVRRKDRVRSENLPMTAGEGGWVGVVGRLLTSSTSRKGEPRARGARGRAAAASTFDVIARSHSHSGNFPAVSQRI